jgi:hypothetical protein
MNEFLKMDIFFVITSVVVVLVGVGMCFVLLRVWRILGHVERVAQMIEEGAQNVTHDIDMIRASISQERVWLVTTAARFLKQVFGKNTRKRR